MTRLNELDANEMFDSCRHLSNSYTREQFDKDFDEFRQIKKSVLRHRAKVAKKIAKRRTLH